MTKATRNARLAKKIEELEHMLKTLERIRYSVEGDKKGWSRVGAEILEAKEEIEDAIESLQDALFFSVK